MTIAFTICKDIISYIFQFHSKIRYFQTTNTLISLALLQKHIKVPVKLIFSSHVIYSRHLFINEDKHYYFLLDSDNWFYVNHDYSNFTDHYLLDNDTNRIKRIKTKRIKRILIT